MILKICGITNQSDADAATEAGANALGFNFYPRSPRFIDPERAATIMTPAGVRRVGIFVNEPRNHVETLAGRAALDIVQLHGYEDPSDYPMRWPVWKAERITAGFDLAALRNCAAAALVLDGPAGDLYGGAGATFDWAQAPWADLGVPVIIAGGLDATNVARAIAAARPWGVDACSRLEAEPGRKDHAKMKAFLYAAREALAP